MTFRIRAVGFAAEFALGGAEALTGPASGKITDVGLFHPGYTNAARDSSSYNSLHLAGVGYGKP